MCGKIWKNMAKNYFSWILPVRNEADSLPQLIREIVKVMGQKKFEILAINDGSVDHTLTTLTSLTSHIPQLNIINLASHQGKWTALMAGFRKASGQIIITSDSDLQDDPKELPKLLKLINSHDLVSGLRSVRLDPLYKVIISRLGNLLASILSGHQFKDLNAPFKVYRRETLDKLPLHGSLIRFSLLFAKNLGYKVVEIPIKHRPRIYGQSKFGIVKYLRILYDLVLVLLLFQGSGRLTKK